MKKDLVNVDEDYIYARVIESLADSLLAIDLFQGGHTRNGAGKAFVAVKSLISALVVKFRDNLVEMAKQENEKEWIKKKGHTAPTHSLKSLGMYFEKIGIDVYLLIEIALDLHDYQYNGFDPDFSPYKDKEQVKNDIIKVVTQVHGLINKYFVENRETMEINEKLKNNLEKFVKEQDQEGSPR
ncbi:hypothetical protein L3N51_00515 [Metallosphaera sp. J1]|uniref:PaREP1 family protein n=1 Tax=Metallosphaera javensis (ex Hofmann et al. 2022) TaxID=99938 RepID=UPI001EDE5C27|nr:PaREP1 family protein [Metallosphaera javensis (ex Hofmann et al. 2022)]MCG3108234.1 hypothetical protein [Metallosphaera javensis (ex Hofmann et al. 2022)]